jgi:hypothetical protein
MAELTVLSHKKHILRSALSLVLLSVLTKTVWLLSIPNQSVLMENDSVRYLQISKNFGTVFFGSNADSDSFFITPGYPFFLSLFPSENLKWVIFCQFILLGMSQIMLFRLILKYTSTKIAFFGLILYLLESSSSLESFNLLTETLFNFVFVLFLLLFGNGANKNLVLCTSGLILGIALIIRPVGQILLIPLLLMFVFKTVRKQIAIVLLIAIAVSGTWIIRNQAVFDVPQLSGIQSLNLLQFEGAGAFAKENDVSLKEAQAAESKLEIIEVGVGASIKATAQYRVERGIDLILSNPVGFVELHLEGAAKILVGPGSANISKLTEHLSLNEVAVNVLKVLIVLMRFLVITLVFISIFFVAKRRIFIPIQFYSIVSWSLILISSGGANAYSRFRVPLIPLEIIIICFGLSSSVQRVWFEKHFLKIRRILYRQRG